PLKADIERIVRETLKENIQPFLEDFLISREKKYEKISLLERIVRVEEGILRIEKRFEDLQTYMDKRFVDMQRNMDKRFVDINKKFSMMFIFMNIGFSILVLITIIFKFIA
ncbi:unnamed protein product, partial [marine sediment metagenome]